MDTHKQVVDRLRSTFKSGVTIPEEFRRSQLTKLMALMKENEERFLQALHKDLAKVLRATHIDPWALRALRIMKTTNRKGQDGCYLGLTGLMLALLPISSCTIFTLHY